MIGCGTRGRPREGRPPSVAVQLLYQRTVPGRALHEMAVRRHYDGQPFGRQAMVCAQAYLAAVPSSVYRKSSETELV